MMSDDGGKDARNTYLPIYERAVVPVSDQEKNSTDVIAPLPQNGELKVIKF